LHSANQSRASALVVFKTVHAFYDKMANRDEEYDTDTVSLTSTVEAAADDEFDIRNILSEGMGEDDNGNPIMLYLIRWKCYPIEE
jgi:hypothetical protein